MEFIIQILLEGIFFIISLKFGDGKNFSKIDLWSIGIMEY